MPTPVCEAGLVMPAWVISKRTEKCINTIKLILYVIKASLRAAQKPRVKRVQRWREGGEDDFITCMSIRYALPNGLSQMSRWEYQTLLMSY